MDDMGAGGADPASPYDPPGARIEAETGIGTLVERIAQAHARARWVVWLLAICMVADALAVLSGFAQQSLLARAAQGEPITDAEASANDWRQRAIGILQVVTYLVTAVMWLRWMHRAYANLTLMGTGTTEHKPGWAVGYWFIPILNLFRPFQITRELWQRSQDRNATVWVRDAGTPLLLGGWWLAWLVSNIVGQIVGRASFGAKELPELQSVTNWGITAAALAVVTAGLALAVVRAIDRLHVQAGSAVASQEEVGSTG